MSTLEVCDYAAALGMNSAKIVKCVMLSPDGLPEAGMRVLTARSAYLKGGDLHLVAPAGELILKNLKPALKDALSNNVPILVMDPARQIEHRIEVHQEAQGATADSKADSFSLPPGFFG